MAPARAFWKGYLKLSLVSCPIALYTGTSATERVSFRQINKKTGNRLRQQLVDEVTREAVEGEAKGRGYEYAKNAYIPVDDDELDASRSRASRPSKSNRSSLAGRSISAISTPPTTSRRTAKSGRTHLR